MIQFNLDTWLQDKNRKVVTRNGREVRIICWDRNTTYWKIVGLVTSPDGSTENPYTYDVNGNESDGSLHHHRNDLFFADEEDGLTEFEDRLASILFDREYEGKTNTEDDIERSMLPYRLAAKEYSQELLDLARKGLWDAEKVCDFLKNKCIFSAANSPVIVEFDGEELVRKLRKAMEE